VENIPSFDSPQIKGFIEKYGAFVKEARKRVIFILIVFAGSTIFGFVFYEKIIRFLIEILGLKGVNIVFTSPFQFINLAASSGIASGLVCSLPFIVAQILSFLRPALKRKEFKMITRFIPFSLILFVSGFLFGALMMKWQIEIFLERSVSIGIGNILDISHLLTTVIVTSSLMGVGFQFPIVLLLLLRLGLIKPAQLTNKRPWIYLGSFIFAILLPPDSILADILLALPLIIMFEITLILNHILQGVSKIRKS
jgi:sec-independent protein translocase protein TatC